MVDELLGPRRGPGRRPKLSDAELVCLAVAQVLLGCSSERRWLRLVRGRLGHLSPYLPTPSADNRRLRRAGPLVALAINDLAVPTPSFCDQLRLVDSTPVPCAASRATVKRSALAGVAGYGYCKSHHRYFWGFRLYVLAAPDGLPMAWCLASPKLGEREVVDHGPAPGADPRRAHRAHTATAPHPAATAVVVWIKQHALSQLPPTFRAAGARSAKER
jgi:hypothetical protein